MSTPLSLPTRGPLGRRLVLRGMGPAGPATPPGPPGRSLPIRGYAGRRTLLRGMGPQGVGELRASVVVRGFGSRRVVSRGFAGAAGRGNIPIVVLFTSDTLGL